MHTDRLALLSARLRKRLPKNTKFYMGYWRKERDCETVCCAIGLAASMPQFRKMGLKLENGAWFDFPVFDGEREFSAAARLFECEYETAIWLFAPESYKGPRGDITPTEVADRIDALIVGGTLAAAKKILGESA